MAPWFDDGDTEIPGGVVGPVERVLVVGAGIAGLTVANAMAHAAVDCVVLEARSRVGGRLHTANLAGFRVDLGGSWMHHPIGNPLRRFAEAVGIGCRPADPLPTLSGFDCLTGLWLSHADVEAGLIVVMEGFTEALPGLRARLGPTASAAEGIESYLEETGLAAEPLRRARQGLCAIVEADAAGRPSTSRWSGSGRRRSTAVTTSGSCPRADMPLWSTRWRPGWTCAGTGRWPAWTFQTEA